MFITTEGDKALEKMERAGVLSASEIKSLRKIALGTDSASHGNIKKSTMTKLIRQILSEVGWVLDMSQLKMKTIELLRTREEEKKDRINSRS